MIIEACVETVKDAVNAENDGAHRLELCSHLELDGLSPSLTLLSEVLKAVTIPVKVMIRTKAGPFIYNDEDLNKMINYCKECIDYPIQGFVTGMITPDQRIDVERLTKLLDTFPDIPFTFHKAIDMIFDPIEEMKRCCQLQNLTHILTSGQQADALSGIPMIRKMVEQLQPRFKIIAAGKIRSENINIIEERTGASEFHGRNILDKKTLSR